MFVRTGELKDPVNTGIEVQILDTHGKADDKLTHHDGGGIIKTAAPSKNMNKPAGEWNDLEWDITKGVAVVKLNGQVIEKAWKIGGNAKKGVGLQRESGDFDFRYVRIKEK